MKSTTQNPVLASVACAPLEVTDLVKRFGDQDVLRGVSLSVEPGTVLGLIGRNGAGKSTLIGSMLGLVQPDAGQATVWGTPALRLTDAIKQRLGYVPQQPEAMDWLQIGEMLDFIGRFYPRWDRRFVDATLERWELPRHRLLSRLSPGERQRVAILRALAPQPDLLVLDEPASALDPAGRRDLLREIAARAGEAGTTVLFSTHIVSDLERVASHVCLLQAGRVLLHTELDVLKERAVRLHVPEAVVTQLDGKVHGELVRRPHPHGGLWITVLPDDGTATPALLQTPGVRAEALTLEDLFIEVSA